MIYLLNRYYKAVLLFIPALSMQSIYSSGCNSNFSYIFNCNKFNNGIIYKVHESYTDDSLNQDINNRIIKNAARYQFLTDSLTRLANQKRMQLKETTDPHKRVMLINEISSLDNEANRYQNKANESYHLAEISDNQAKSKEDTLEGRIRLVKEINGIKIYQYVSLDSEEDSEGPLLSASDIKTSMVYTDRNIQSETDDFEIFPASPYSKLNPIPSNINLPDGLIFRIQLGAFSKPVSNDTFKGLSPVSYEVVNGKIKYYTGIFYSSENAGKALKDIREYGFSDSFLVPFYNGIIISIEKAKEIEYSQIKL